MTEDFSASDYLEEQLALSRATWARLQEHGVTDGSVLQLDFFYAAPTSPCALGLKQFLEQETDYDVSVTADRDHWIVRGKTVRAPLSRAMVEQWVDWMVTAGFQFECVFDGWGAEAP